jgi:hypothetical protein
VGSAAANTGAALVVMLSPANTTDEFIFTEHHELTLAPGDQYTVWATVANQGIDVTYYWRERVLEEGELTG